MKKSLYLLIALLVIVLAFSFSGCKKNETTNPDVPPQSNSGDQLQSGTEGGANVDNNNQDDEIYGNEEENNSTTETPGSTTPSTGSGNSGNSGNTGNTGSTSGDDSGNNNQGSSDGDQGSIDPETPVNDGYSNIYPL